MTQSKPRLLSGHLIGYNRRMFLFLFISLSGMHGWMHFVLC